MQNNLLRKSVVFGMVLAMVAVMFAPVTMNVSATCPCAGSTETVANVDRIENATRIIAEQSSGEGEAAISFRMEEITVMEHPSAPPRSGSERDDPAMYLPTYSNITALGDSPTECENGCGSNDWKGVIIGTVLDPVFKESCNRHDRCYCHGYVTYGKNRARCDDDFRDDMKGDCYDTFCKEILGVTICEPASYSTCISVAGIAYGAVRLEGEEHYIKHGEQTCYDYDNRGGDWACPAENPTTVYVDGAFTGWPQHGTEGKPVTTVAAGVGKVAPGGTVIIAAGSYPESIVISKSMTLEASGGSVVIGE